MLTSFMSMTGVSANTPKTSTITTAALDDAGATKSSANPANHRAITKRTGQCLRNARQRS
jgi:hypothetical protein